MISDTLYSDCPTPTVSIKIISFPLNAKISLKSSANSVTPPSSARDPILLTKTLSSFTALLILTLSPRKEPPVIGLEGSIAITPTDKFSFLI